MPKRTVVVAVAALLVAQVSCTERTTTIRQLAFQVLGDSLVPVNTDSLLVDADTIRLLAGEDTLGIEGDVLRIWSSEPDTESTAGRELVYALRNTGNASLAEVRFSTSKATGGVEVFRAKGDVVRISRHLAELMSQLNVIVVVEFERLEVEGTLTVRPGG